MTIIEAILSCKPFMRKGVHPQWLRTCGLHNSMIGWSRKVHHPDGGKTGDWKYIDITVQDIIADDWEVKND